MKTKILLSTAIVAAGFMAISPANAGGLLMPNLQMMAHKSKPTLLGSSNFEGKTTTVFRRDDGAHIVNIRDGQGIRTEVHQRPGPGISVDDGKGGWKPWTPKPKSDELGSSTYEGVTTTVRKNKDGSHTVITDDGKGGRREVVRQVFEKGSIYVDDGQGGWKKYTPKAKGRFPRVIGSSTYDGLTTTVTLNADGSHTVTVTDQGGNVLSTETHAPGR